MISFKKNKNKFLLTPDLWTVFFLSIWQSSVVLHITCCFCIVFSKFWKCCIFCAHTSPFFLHQQGSSRERDAVMWSVISVVDNIKTLAWICLVLHCILWCVISAALNSCLSCLFTNERHISFPKSGFLWFTIYVNEPTAVRKDCSAFCCQAVGASQLESDVSETQANGTLMYWHVLHIKTLFCFKFP